MAPNTFSPDFQGGSVDEQLEYLYLRRSALDNLIASLELYSRCSEEQPERIGSGMAGRLLQSYAC
jgi:hypothetical protein